MIIDDNNEFDMPFFFWSAIFNKEEFHETIIIMYGPGLVMTYAIRVLTLLLCFIF